VTRFSSTYNFCHLPVAKLRHWRTVTISQPA
jgi:hypothetical protein